MWLNEQVHVIMFKQSFLLQLLTYSQQVNYPVIPYKLNLLLPQLQTAQYKVYRDFPPINQKNILTTACLFVCSAVNLMLLPACSPGV